MPETYVVATVPALVWVGLVAMGSLIIAASVRLGFFDHLGASLAGDNKQRREGLARTGTHDGAAKVAKFASMLADSEEVRLIRWTPARTAEGVRIALGASPKAWYLWLPVPMVLIRVPDGYIDQMHQDERGDGVVRLRCDMRPCDEPVTATDGETIEEAADSLELAHSLLAGLVIVDPVAKQQPVVKTTTADTTAVAPAMAEHQRNEPTIEQAVSLAG